MAKTNWSMVIIKGLITAACFTAIFWFGIQQSVVFSDVVSALASIPLFVVLAVELIDKFVDKRDMIDRFGSYGNNQSQQYLLMFLGTGITFLAIVWAITGSLTLGLGSVSPALLVVAGLIAVYVIAPETGPTEFIFWAWVASQVITQGSHLVFIPQIPGFMG